MFIFLLILDLIFKHGDTIKSETFIIRGHLAPWPWMEFKRKESPTVFDLFCFLIGVFLGTKSKWNSDSRSEFQWYTVSPVESALLWSLCLSWTWFRRQPCYLTMPSLEGVGYIGRRECPQSYKCRSKKNNYSERGKENQHIVFLKGDILKTMGQKDRSSPRKTPTGKSCRAEKYKPADLRACALADNGCCTPPTPLELNSKIWIETIELKFLQFYSTTQGASGSSLQKISRQILKEWKYLKSKMHPWWVLQCWMRESIWRVPHEQVCDFVVTWGRMNSL